MSDDLANVLKGWISRDNHQSARILRTYDGQAVLQYYEAHAVMQMQLSGRPDGVRPGGYESMLHLLSASRNNAPDDKVEVTPQQWMELDREFAQYQQRRRAALMVAADAFLDDRTDEAAPLYRLAVSDVQHCLAIIDFAMSEHPSHRLISAQPELRPILISQRHIASAQMEVMNGNVEAAVDQLKEGLHLVNELLESSPQQQDASSNPCARDLLTLEQAIRQKYNLGKTQREQLDDALAREDYELAATLRDRIAEKDRSTVEHLQNSV